MATCKPDFPEGEASTSDRRPEGIEGRMRRNRGNARRALARRAQARWRSQNTAGSSPTQHQSATHSWNQPRQVWQPRAPRNVRLLTPGASTNAPYPANDVQGEGCNMNVNQELVEGGQSQAGALSPPEEISSPNQVQDAPGILHTPFQPPAPNQHQLPAMHDHLPAVNTPPPNITPYDVHGYVPCPPGNLPCPPNMNFPYPLGNLPCPPNMNFQYPLGNLPCPPNMNFPFPLGNLPCPPNMNFPSPPGNLPYPLMNLPYPPGNLPFPPMDLPYHPGNLPYPHMNLPCPPMDLPYPHMNLPYTPRNLPCPPGNLPGPPMNLPYPPGYVLQYPLGIVPYPYLQYSTPPYW